MLTHAAYHTLFNSFPAWKAKVCLETKRFYSRKQKKVDEALKTLFGEHTSLQERCQILDNRWTPSIPVREAQKLFDYGEIDSSQLLWLDFLGKITGPRVAIEGLVKTARTFAQAA